jgi:hypothetical protein
MKDSDYKFTLKYLHVYGRKVVNAIKQRINGSLGYERLIDTRAMLKSVDYKVAFTKKTIFVDIFIGEGPFNYSDRPPGPETYSVFLDKGTKYIFPHGFFSDPIPGLTTKDFQKQVKIEVAKDLAVWARKELKEAFGQK